MIAYHQRFPRNTYLLTPNKYNMAFEKAIERLKFPYMPFHIKTHSLPVPFFHSPSDDNFFIPTVTTLISTDQ